MIPRPEHPRPDFERNDWQSLNGEWHFEFDDEDRGVADGWFGGGYDFRRRIQVPFAYQWPLSGIDDQGLHPIVWYAREFTVPDTWAEDVLLHFGAVDYASTVWINGREVGSNRGGHVPFSFNIRPYLHTGTNVVVVRVEDRQDPCQPRGKQVVSGRPEGCFYTCTTGIWQSVWLERVPKVRIDTLRIVPVLGEDGGSDEFELSITLHAPDSAWTLDVAVLNGDQVVAQRRETGGAAHRIRVPIPQAIRWTPETPFLYRLIFRLGMEGEQIDEVRTYAGMRTIRTSGNRILLNGRPVFLRMVLDQGYWPDGGMTAPTDDALRFDVEATRAMGFNGVRKHQKVEDPRWLYWCDRLGLLVWAEMANAMAWSPEAEAMLSSEWERVILRDVNHPCVVTWVPVNESWGVPGLRKEDPRHFAFLERLVALTRRLDGTRPVIDNDGWEHTDLSDIAAIHDYTPSGEGLKLRFADHLAGGELPARTWHEGHLAHFLPGARYRGQPIVLSEVGGFLMSPPSDEPLDPLYAIYGTIRSQEELLARYQELIGGIAELTFLSGFCYTQLTDLQQEVNGLLTWSREAKVPMAEVAEIHAKAFCD